MSTKLSRTLTWTETIDARYNKARQPLLLTAFATLGIIYGDIGTSPLYVINGIFSSSGPAPSTEDVLGAISAIVWSLMLTPLIKYSLIALEFGTMEGEGGPFALFSQLYPKEQPGREMTLPTIHSANTESSTRPRVLDKPWIKTVIQGITLFAVALIMSDGILTPSVSVVSAVGGIAVAKPSVTSEITGISIAILIALFLAQQFGTSRLSFTFAPIVTIWLALIAGTGIYNIVQYPGIFRAFDPSRAVMFFVRAGSITPLSGVLLAITGVEALFANLGQFTKAAIRISFALYVYPCLTLAYLGQGARMITDGDVISNVFYNTIPGVTGGPLWWIVWIFGILATIVASQAMITATFSLIQQMVGLGSFPTVRIIHTSDKHRGQIYAPVINFLLMIGCIGVTAGFGTDEALTNAYGMAVSGVLLMTTFLLTLVMINVNRLHILIAVTFFVLTGFIDTIFFSSAINKVPHGAWFTLSLAVAIGIFLSFWTWSKGLEDAFDASHRTRLNQLLTRRGGNDKDEKTAGSDDTCAITAVSQVNEMAVRDGSDKSEADAAGKIKIVNDDRAWAGDLLNTPQGPMALPRLETMSFFHHLGSGQGAPHSFTAFIKHQPSLPRINVFLSIRVVGVPRLEDEDKYVIDRLRSFSGFYVMTLRLGYRDDVDLRKLVNPVLSRLIALERGSVLPGKDAVLDEKIRIMENAAKNITHILPTYYVTSKGTNFEHPVVKRAAKITRRFLLEEVYRRVSQNFPITNGYEADESKILRIGINADI